MTAKDVVLQFWQAMRGNDFDAAAQWLAEDFENYAPQSSEVIVGRANFAAVNANYPAAGRWQFDVNTIVAEGDQVVTDVAITDGVVAARAITFHTVVDGLISRQTEFWPDDYAAPAWRAAWVRIDNRGKCNEVPGA